MATDHDLLIEIHSDVRALLKAQTDHETRLRVLEKFAYKLIGILVVAATVASIAVEFAKRKILGS